MKDRRFTDNPYYSPEKCGLEIVADMDDPNCSYDFEMRVLWRDLESGNLYTAGDSGCSCPTPFEDFKNLAALERVTKYEQVVELVKKQNEYGRWPQHSTDVFLDKARKAFPKKVSKLTGGGSK